MEQFIRNIPFSESLSLSGLVDYQPGKVISVTFVQNPTLSFTLFAFAGGESISGHSAPGDAMVYILDGEAEITIDEKKIVAKTGQVVVMPAEIPHAIYATTNFKMLLILVK